MTDPTTSSTAASTTLSDVHHEIRVALGQADAFTAFLDLDSFKPRDHNLMDAPIEQTVLEPRVGGDIYDRATDGTICRWGRVVAIDAPYRLVFSWLIGPTWQVETDPAHASEVEVTFEPEGRSQTRVRLTHRHLERHGEGWESVRDGVGADRGWPLYLSNYVDAATGSASPA